MSENYYFVIPERKMRFYIGRNVGGINDAPNIVVENIRNLLQVIETEVVDFENVNLAELTLGNITKLMTTYKQCEYLAFNNMEISIIIVWLKEKFPTGIIVGENNEKFKEYAEFEKF